MYLSTSKIT